jgi:hypothetical protein
VDWFVRNMHHVSNLLLTSQGTFNEFYEAIRVFKGSRMHNDFYLVSPYTKIVIVGECIICMLEKYIILRQGMK